ncbi:hypothetical protein CTA21_16465 [Salmonella enterica]|nr:hypothetical protein [Salmonella enterica]
MKKLLASLLVLAASAGVVHANPTVCLIDTPAKTLNVEVDMTPGALQIIDLGNSALPQIFKDADIQVINRKVALVDGHDMICASDVFNAPKSTLPEGSEFGERGDIARPEYKGANTFIGVATLGDGTIAATVKIERESNGDIKLTFNGEKESRTYKKDADLNMDGAAGTYQETRLSTDVYLAPNMYYSIINTQLVK